MANIVPHSLEQPGPPGLGSYGAGQRGAPHASLTGKASLTGASPAWQCSSSRGLPEKFINLLMVDGKKNTATQIFCSAAHQFLLSTIEKPPVLGEVEPAFFETCLRIAVRNVQPNLECRRCRVAGTSHQVPAIVSEKRGESLAVRWIIESARKRRKNSKLRISQCLTQELLDAYEKQGRPRQRRDQSHKLASGNRGYLRYRWW